ncbi:heme ABC exporter ATP-binding protein CcmA [Luteimonas sp. RD2P54]|uniref:Heme ABC exporter ATP-binding protein CcmA n=1 Tax=Luteimonas endophytica TaxID=3042023 RepID=A0ABT6J4W7_9GAMM|nr:heme ABC exporter ATP-binding protein CcmA [Luteimonas endophytica]MDH5821660.1 heme ABC exporter ATP-binding protein CcmA [Luteimonas endophytica]
MSDASPPPPLLAACGLGFSRNDVPVFGPLDLDVARGEALLIRGGNGAGKTTLLRVLAGLLHAESGTIAVDGRRASPGARARTIAYLGHLPAFKADLGALENLAFLCGLHGRRPGRAPEAALALVGLAGYEDTPARQLSAGQKKRLSLARMWLSPAPLWLLDEPYANLDLEGVDLVNRLVRAHLEDGGAALVTTHGAYAAPPVRTRTLVLEQAHPPLHRTVAAMATADRPAARDDRRTAG